MDNGASSYRCFLDGDDAGLTEIIESCYDGLVLYLNAYLGDLSAAEDAAEDAFVRLAVKKPRFSGKSSFRTWLYAIGRNIARDRLRRNAGRSSLPLDEAAQSASDEDIEKNYIREEKRIALYRALRKLPPEYRQVLWLTYFEGFKAGETARIMRKTLSSVEHLIRRARAALKAELEPEFEKGDFEL